MSHCQSWLVWKDYSWHSLELPPHWSGLSDRYATTLAKAARQKREDVATASVAWVRTATPHAQTRCLARSDRTVDIFLPFSNTRLLALVPLIVRARSLKGVILSKKLFQMSLRITDPTSPCCAVILQSTCHNLQLLHPEDCEFLGDRDCVFFIFMLKRSLSCSSTQWIYSHII